MVRAGTLLWLGAGLAGGCAGFTKRAASGLTDGLSAAILDEDDPQLVRDGTPAYLILLDALVRSDPDDPGYLGAAAQLYAAYGTAFVADGARSERLTARGRDYGVRGICAADRHACGLDQLDFEAYTNVIDGVAPADAGYLYSYCVGSLAYVRAHSEDWTAIATLPRVEYALQRLLAMPDPPHAADVNMYLGILNTLRPEALGGKPELGREYFERGIALSGGRNLTIKVEFARSYARLVYNRELHDRLLHEVLDSPVHEEGLTLFNTLAQEQARQLLASADDYF